mmetsp:Transcript_23544/g.42551  ORF Transcript_23544/g.42551 Transcript_23544/m.42551 type:complete len:106 (+) Transcript_23544:123-440(+)
MRRYAEGLALNLSIAAMMHSGQRKIFFSLDPSSSPLSTALVVKVTDDRRLRMPSSRRKYRVGCRELEIPRRRNKGDAVDDNDDEDDNEATLPPPRLLIDVDGNGR